MGSSYGYGLAVCLCVPGLLPLEEYWQTCRCPDVMIPWLPEAARTVIFALLFGLHSRPGPFWILCFLLLYPFQQDSVPAPQLTLSLRASRRLSAIILYDSSASCPN